jgi:hypothetical protein
MTVKKAIAILKNQKEKLDHPTEFHRDENWVFQTASYIKDFFGDNSTEYSFISQFRFGVLRSNWDSDQDVSRWIAEKPIQAKKYLDNCIETLQNKGLYNLPKQNFVNRLNDTALWAIISISIPALISIGFFFGNLYTDKQNIELRQDNKLLRDSLFTLKGSATNTSEKEPDKTTQKSTFHDTIK